MSQASPVPAVLSCQVHDLLQHRLEKALRRRLRYRYVRPNVLAEGAGYRIQSPCCSRKVDPSGGLIDIARLTHVDQCWHLSARDHTTHTWIDRFQHESFDTVLNLLCTDSEREFWP